jgi:hypothetical protein
MSAAQLPPLSVAEMRNDGNLACRKSVHIALLQTAALSADFLSTHRTSEKRSRQHIAGVKNTPRHLRTESRFGGVQIEFILARQREINVDSSLRLTVLLQERS